VGSKGALAPVIFVFIQAGQVVLAPVPGEMTGFLAGALFGPWKGFVLAMVGLALGSSAAFGLGRIFRERVKRHLAEKRFYRRITEFTRRRGPAAAFLLFLFPGFPKDYLCYALGLLPMPFRVFFPIMLLGRAPATLVLTVQGDAALTGHWKTLLAATLPVVILWLLLRPFLTGEDTPVAS